MVIHWEPALLRVMTTIVTTGMVATVVTTGMAATEAATGVVTAAVTVAAIK